ncbi:MAG: cation diffusion facilitator family transporter [Caulobacteraceae bacterium]
MAFLDHSHTALAGALPIEDTAALTRRAARLSVAVASVLALIKLAAWLASGSIAMLASLADSGLDILASSATFLAIRYAASPPDREHRYGHGKAEAFASLLQAGLVMGSAALVGEEAVRHLIAPKPIQAEGWALAVMAVSVALTVVLLRVQTRVLGQTSSVAVAGDRAHYAVDLASNLAAMVGIGLTAWLGSARYDAAAGLFVTGWLVWGAIQVFRDSASQLMDHELPDEARAEIVARMIADPRIRGVHQLRTRASGPYVHVQMHADMDPALSLEQAHHVLVAAENRVLEAFPAADIIIHPDPQDRAEAHGGAFAEADRHDHHEHAPAVAAQGG